jgi:hypothetical protein
MGKMYLQGIVFTGHSIASEELASWKNGQSVATGHSVSIGQGVASEVSTATGQSIATRQVPAGHCTASRHRFSTGYKMCHSRFSETSAKILHNFPLTCEEFHVS